VDHGLAPREREQALGELGGALGGGADVGQRLPRVARGGQLQVPQDDLQQIVEIVRDAPRELPDRIEPLRVAQLGLQRLARRLGRLALRDVQERHDRAAHPARVFIVQRHGAEHGPRRLPVGPPHADGGGGLRLAGAHRQRHGIGVGGAEGAVFPDRHRLELGGVALGQRVIAQPEHPQRLGVGGHDRAIGADVHDPTRNRLQDAARQLIRIMKTRSSRVSTRQSGQAHSRRVRRRRMRGPRCPCVAYHASQPALPHNNGPAPIELTARTESSNHP
jgi:hypothetical protein